MPGNSDFDPSTGTEDVFTDPTPESSPSSGPTARDVEDSKQNDALGLVEGDLTTYYPLIEGAAQKSANLDDLASAATARTNLGLGSAATLNQNQVVTSITAADSSVVVGGTTSSPTVSAAAAIAGLVPRMQSAWIYNASGTWVVPAGVNLVEIECLGAGGGGGGGGAAALTSGVTNQCGGGGGGAGALVRRIVAVTPGQTLTVTVGAGGTGGTGAAASTGSTGNAGTNGGRGTASFVTGATGGTVQAYSGGWGTAGAANSGTQQAGGAKSASYSIPSTYNPTGIAGNGAPSAGYGYMGDDGVGGGGGGGTATASLGGGAGQVLTGLNAANTAAIVQSTTINGVNGVTATLAGCGGGGGGGGAPGGSGGNGGAGGPGYVTIKIVG